MGLKSSWGASEVTGRASDIPGCGWNTLRDGEKKNEKKMEEGE